MQILKHHFPEVSYLPGLPAAAASDHGTRDATITASLLGTSIPFQWRLEPLWSGQSRVQAYCLWTHQQISVTDLNCSLPGFSSALCRMTPLTFPQSLPLILPSTFLHPFQIQSYPEAYYSIWPFVYSYKRW